MARGNATPKPKSKSTGPRDRVYEIAAEVFHRQGYDNTSMNDIAEAVGLTKAGLYHHVSSKERLLYTILDYGMDMTETHVVRPLEAIGDPVHRLMRMIELHLKLLLEGRKLAVTGLLHECQGLSRRDRAKINRRKKAYVQLVSDLIAQVLEKSRGRDAGGRAVNPKMAALALLGMLNWTYQWYKPGGAIPPEQVVREFQGLFIHGILGAENQAAAGVDRMVQTNGTLAVLLGEA